MMFNPIYKVRPRLPTDTRRAPFVSLKNPHLIVAGLLRWRILLTRYGPRWWVALNRIECWKYWRTRK